MAGFTFNGITKSYIKIRTPIRPSWAAVKRNILNISGMAGGLLDETNVDPREVTIPIRIDSTSISSLQKVKEDLASWLITDDVKPLIFDDETDRVYYAVVDGSLDLDELLYYGKGDITFICPDPYKYSAADSVSTFAYSGVVQTLGNANANPVITVNVSKDTTFLAVGNGSDLNMIGLPAEVTQTPYAREQRVFWDQMGSLTGWTDSTSVEEGAVGGAFATNGYVFNSSSYGTGTGWHGPAKRIAIGQTLTDFQVDALVYLKGSSGQVGSVEIALLDASNNFVCKMQMTKRSANNQANWARMRAGSYANGFDFVNSRGSYDWVWSTFDGILRIGRIGNYWYAYVALSDAKGKQSAALWADWTDVNNIASAAVSQVQVQLRQYGTIPVAAQNIADVKVFKINSQAANTIPYIAKAGDVVEFDHSTNIIRRNGEDITKEKAFVGQYFPLYPGGNSIMIEPSDSVSATEVRWKDRWR
jgi:predicted phage tail component-like protein